MPLAGSQACDHLTVSPATIFCVSACVCACIQVPAELEKSFGSLGAAGVWETPDLAGVLMMEQ